MVAAVYYGEKRLVKRLGDFFFIYNCENGKIFIYILGEYPCLAASVSSVRQLTICNIVVSVSYNVKNRT